MPERDIISYTASDEMPVGVQYKWSAKDDYYVYSSDGSRWGEEEIVEYKLNDRIKVAWPKKEICRTPNGRLFQGYDEGLGRLIRIKRIINAINEYVLVFRVIETNNVLFYVFSEGNHLYTRNSMNFDKLNDYLISNYSITITQNSMFEKCESILATDFKHIN